MLVKKYSANFKKIHRVVFEFLIKENSARS